jgi:hypothetical protein
LAFQGDPDFATGGTSSANAAIEKNDAAYLRGLLQPGGLGDYDTRC